MMRYVVALVLSVVSFHCSLAQGKINYTISNGLQIAGVDGTNPVIYDNDWVLDTPEMFYLWLKANRRQINLVGNISTRNLFIPPNVQNTHESTWVEWTNAYSAAVATGLQNIPQPIKGADWYLSKPASGVIEQTVRKDSPGSDLIVSEAHKASPSKPLIVIVGGQATTLANAYLKDNSIVDRIIVFHTDGWGVTQFNGVDYWANEIVMRRMKYINWDGNQNSWYTPYLPINVSIAGIPNNAFTKLYLNHYYNDVYQLFHDVGDGPPVAYLSNHALFRNVVRKNAANQTVTADNYDFLLISDNDFQGLGAEIGNFIRDPNNYIPANQPPTNQPPVVNIASPANNSNFTVGASVTISANASDPDNPIQRVEFFNGSTKIGEDLSSPYSFVWSSATPGTYSITAKATDNAGAATTSSAVSITISANAPPTVNITSPANNATFTAGTSVVMSANASDSDGSISKVEFYSGATKVGEDTSNPYSFNWNAPGAGTHTLTAKAIDNLGVTTTSASHTMVVTAANILPSVNLTSPANNASFPVNSNITINANASDTDGSVAKVEFFSGTTKLGEDLTSPYSFVWASVGAGNYTISAKAIDNVGAITTSAARSLSVVIPNAAPVVTLTGPVNNANFPANSNITISANATDADGSVAKVEFFSGTTKLGEDLTSPYSFVWASVAPGNYTISARATDNVGATTSTSAVSVSVSAANVLPVVTITSPANNANFPLNSSITITATSSDSDGTVTKVEFYSGVTKLGEDLTSPYSFVWASVGAGTYTITAKATDNVGATATTPARTVTVSNANATPTVNITSPANNAGFSTNSSITINASAADADGTVAKVEFYNGNTKIGEDLTSPYTFVWTSVPNGNYALTARAVDNLNAAITSAAINIVVSTTPVAPVVTITSPANNASFTAGANISIVATGTATTGTISKIQFFNGATKLGEDLSAPYSFTWSNVAIGSYNITATATTDQGISASHNIQINVVASPTESPTNPNPSNIAPIADAGADVSVQLPIKNISINGRGSDPDGTITKYEWTEVAATNEISYAQSPSGELTLTNLSEGSYTFELTVTDNGNRTATDQVEISILPTPMATNIPRYFSPNNDGVNDVWEWPNIELYENSPLIIFNRFGQKIFETTSYQNNWNGTVDGKPLQDDAYYYSIRLSHTDIRGAVRIVR